MFLSKKKGVLLSMFVACAVIIGASCSVEVKDTPSGQPEPQQNKGIPGTLKDWWSKWFPPPATPPPPPESSKKRHVTVINKTGCRSVSVRVSAVDSANGLVPITGFPKSDTIEPNSSHPYVIERRYDKYSTLEAELTDRSKRRYAVKFRAPLKDNTIAHITKDDRVSEGFFTNKAKDLEAVMNGDCK